MGALFPLLISLPILIAIAAAERVARKQQKPLLAFAAGVLVTTAVAGVLGALAGIVIGWDVVTGNAKGWFFESSRSNPVGGAVFVALIGAMAYGGAGFVVGIVVGLIFAARCSSQK
jgi:ABC-type phosphate transport system permease subunit